MIKCNNTIKNNCMILLSAVGDNRGFEVWVLRVMLGYDWSENHFNFRCVFYLCLRAFTAILDISNYLRRKSGLAISVYCKNYMNDWAFKYAYLTFSKIEQTYILTNINTGWTALKSIGDRLGLFSALPLQLQANISIVE